MAGWILDNLTVDGAPFCISIYQGDVDKSSCAIFVGEENCLTKKFKVEAAGKYVPEECTKGA